MIKIFTDSTSYVPNDIQSEFDIAVIPLTIEIDGKEIPETQISNESFYELIKKTNKIPRTKPLASEEIFHAFEVEIQKGNTIIAIFLSSKISDTYKNGCFAKEKLIEKINKVGDKEVIGEEEISAFIKSPQLKGD